MTDAEIERLARKLHDAHRTFPTEWEKLLPASRSHWRHLARLAEQFILSAQKEPTP